MGGSSHFRNLSENLVPGGSNDFRNIHTDAALPEIFGLTARVPGLVPSNKHI